jgi:hypothetical protein
LLALFGDPDAAFRSAVALAEGLVPHQIDGVPFRFPSLKDTSLIRRKSGDTRAGIVAE